MIREFSAENYLSIDSHQKLSFVAKGPASELVAEVAPGVYLYKLGILFGANASGKSNMLFAMNQVFRLLVLPKVDATEKISGYIPFIPREGQPSCLDVSFYIRGVRYDYTVKFYARFIQTETLYYYPKGSRALFYERSFVGENVQASIKFGASLQLTQKTQEAIRENTLNNHSVLSVCRKAAFKDDIQILSELHQSIMEQYHEVNGDKDLSLTDILKEAYSDERKRRFYNTMLRKADLNIIDFRPVTIEEELPEAIRELIANGNLPEAVKQQIENRFHDSAEFTNAYKAGTFDIPLNLQSMGTGKYLKLLGALYDMITAPNIYFLDELGEDLHYELQIYYLSVFLFNSEKSQLIMTSQELSLLSLDLLNDNRGAVWFVEKNRDTASSEYMQADTYGLNSKASLYDAYTIGRLGAKPELGSIFINLDD